MLQLGGISNSFKKDIKLLKKQQKKYELLENIINIILEERDIPINYRRHKLSGSYQGYWELHIQPDWLLIYKIIDNQLYLVRTGSHSELFI